MYYEYYKIDELCVKSLTNFNNKNYEQRIKLLRKLDGLRKEYKEKEGERNQYSFKTLILREFFI